MNDNVNDITQADLRAAYDRAAQYLINDPAVPKGAQDAAQAAISALDALSRAIERIQLKKRLTAIEKQAKADRARLAELDGDA